MIETEAGLAPSGFPAAQFRNAAASRHHNIEQTPDGKPPGVRRLAAQARAMETEAGLAPSGSPAALSSHARAAFLARI